VTSLLSGLGIGSVYALVALGFSFIFTTTDSFNFAQGQMVAVGSLLAFSIYMQLGVPAAAAIIIVMVLVGILGGAVERIAIFPLARRGDNDPLLWIMSTLGITSILTGLSLTIWGSQPLGVNNYVGPAVTHFGKSYVQTPYLVAFALAIVITLAVWLFQTRTRWGRVMRASADNRVAVQLACVNTFNYGLVAYALGAVLAGAAGFIIAPVTFAIADAGLTFTILGFAAMAMGGFGSYWGALVGGWMVGVIATLAGTYSGLESSNFAVFIVLLVVLMIRPDGIFSFGKSRRV
jgi:branched-chain amino acid transport system permease protein